MLKLVITSVKDNISAEEMTNQEPDNTTKKIILELAGQHNLQK